MKNRLAYEKFTFSQTLSPTELSLDELASLTAYEGTEPSKDTCHDGHLVRILFELPVLADAAELTVDILGPFWDRIFRITFTGVLDVSDFKSHVNGMDVSDIKLVANPDGTLSCSILGFSFNEEFTVMYKHANVARYMLLAPLERDRAGI